MDFEDVHVGGMRSCDEEIGLVGRPEYLVECVGCCLGVGEKGNFSLWRIEIPNGECTSGVDGGKDGRMEVGPGNVHDVVVEIREDGQRFGREFGMPQADAPIHGRSEHEVVQTVLEGRGRRSSSRGAKVGWERRLGRMDAYGAQRGLVASEMLQQTLAIAVTLTGEERTIFGCHEEGVFIAEGDASDGNFVGA